MYLRWTLQFRRTLAVLILASISIISHAAPFPGTTRLLQLYSDALPTVRFIGLRHYSFASTQIPLTVEATDDLGVSRIELYIDQIPIQTSEIVPNQTFIVVNFNWTGTAHGKHLLQAKAYDESGNSQETSVVVMVRNFDDPSPTPTPIPTPTPMPSNQAPVVNAGPDQAVTLPSIVTLGGSATDDGLPNPPAILTTAWSKVSGPGTVSFGNAGALNTTANFSAAGNYVLRLTANDSSLAATDDIAVTVNASGGSGSLSVTSAVTPANVNLSLEGTADWAHWGLNSSSSFNHKSGVAQQISNYAQLGAGSIQQFTGSGTTYDWTGGTPTSAASVATGLWVIGLNNGYQITVPADTTVRTLKMYVGLWAAGGRFEASLSDGSTPVYVDSSLVNTSDTSNRVYTLSYQAASPGQNLTVKWTVNQTFNAGSNVTLQAATLTSSGPTPTPTPAPTPTQTPTPTPSGNTITLLPAVSYQIMDGWEATDQAGQVASSAFNNYKNALFDQAVGDLGLNRIRLEVPSGIENPTDYFAQMLAGQITYSAYNSQRYEIINDNSSPYSINPNGYKWSSLDHSIDNVVLPLRQRLQARGETLWINANYIDFGPSAFEHKNNPAEYAEFVLATYQHMQSRYGFVPNSWEVILEPDTSGASWSSTQTAEAIKAAGDMLTANGFAPNFVAPSVTNIGNATSYINQIANTSGAMAYVSEFAFHRYGGATNTQLQAVANLAALHGKKTSMLEWIGADHNTLHQDLKFGRVSSWQQYTLAFIDEGLGDNGAQYFIINDANPSNPIINMANRTKFLSQYFRYIRAGARRIEALTVNNNFDPVAFINTNGKYVVVVKAAANGSFGIQGLPAGTYGIKYTTGSQYNIDLPDVAISAGQGFTANIPNSGVITVYAR